MNRYGSKIFNHFGVCSFDVAMSALDVSAMNRTQIAGLLIVKICLSDGCGSILFLYTDILEFTH